MNQILSTNDKSGNSLLGLKPVVRFFAIIIIIISLIFIGQAGFKLYNSMKHQTEYPRATLEAEQFGSVINLKFKDDAVISRIEYAWGNANATALKGIGKKEANIDIDVPQGENVLNVSVIDVDGNKTKFKGFKVTFSEADVVNDKDRIQPVISIEKSAASKKIVITVKDNKELDFISYNWEGEQPTVVKAKEEDKTVITEEVAVKKGTKVLNVKASDKAGNEATKNLTVIGSEGPKVSASIKDSSFAVKVTSENAITKIEYTHNGEEHKVENIPANSKEFEFKVPLKDGENYLKINAYEDEIMTEYKCKKTK